MAKPNARVTRKKTPYYRNGAYYANKSAWKKAKTGDNKDKK